MRCDAMRCKTTHNHIQMVNEENRLCCYYNLSTNTLFAKLQSYVDLICECLCNIHAKTKTKTNNSTLLRESSTINVSFFCVCFCLCAWHMHYIDSYGILLFSVSTIFIQIFKRIIQSFSIHRKSSKFQS